MRLGDAHQVLVACLFGGVKNDADVHHDVDEDRIFAVKRSQILAFLVEPHGEHLAGADDDVVERFVRPAVAHGGVVPALVGPVMEDEAQVVNLAIFLTVLKLLRIMLGALPPELRVVCDGSANANDDNVDERTQPMEVLYTSRTIDIL